MAKNKYAGVKVGPSTFPVKVGSPEVAEMVRKLRAAASSGGRYGDYGRGGDGFYADSTEISIEIDRYDRHDHGGGPDGDDWMDSGQIRDQEERAEKAYGGRVATCDAILKEYGFQETTSIDIGEKGHVSIEISLAKYVSDDVMAMRAKVAAGDASKADLTKWAGSDDKYLRYLVASETNTPKAVLSKMASEADQKQDSYLVKNRSLPKSDIADIFKRYAGDGKRPTNESIILKIAIHPSTPTKILSEIEKMSDTPSLSYLKTALTSNPSWDESKADGVLNGNLKKVIEDSARIEWFGKDFILKVIKKAMETGFLDKMEGYERGSALRGWIKNPSSDDEVISEILKMKIFYKKEGCDYIANILSSNSISATLLDEVFKQSMAAYYGDEKENIFEAYVKNGKSSKTTIELYLPNFVTKNSLGWGKSDLGDLLAKKLGFMDAVDLLGKGGKAKRESVAKLVEVAKNAPPTVLLSIIETSDELPSEFVDGVVDRYHEKTRFSKENAPTRKLLSILTTQKNLSSDRMNKVFELLEKIDNSSVMLSWDHSKEINSLLSHNISERLDVKGLITTLKGGIKGKAKERLIDIMKNGSEDALKLILGPDDMPENIATWAFKNRNESGFDKLLICFTLAANPSTPPGILSDISEEVFGRYREGDAVKSRVAKNKSTPTGTLKSLATHHNEEVRAAVAGNKNTPRDVLKQLVDDREQHVRNRAAENLADGDNSDSRRSRYSRW